MPQYPILQPPQESFEQALSQPELITSYKQAVYLTTRIEYTPWGIYRYNMGCLFPEKGFPTPQILANVNIAKRVTMALVMSVATKEAVLPFIGFVFLPYKKKIKFLENALTHYLRITEQVLSSSFLKKEYYSPFCKELWKFLTFFLTNLGINEGIAYRTAKTFITLIEYDNAYRLRIEDLMFEAKDLSRKDIIRILGLYKERETGFTDNGTGVGERFLAFGKILTLILYLPKIKKAFYSALKEIDFSKLRMDEADSYYCLLRDDYHFFGEDEQTRIKRWYEIHNNILPPQILVNG